MVLLKKISRVLLLVSLFTFWISVWSVSAAEFVTINGKTYLFFEGLAKQEKDGKWGFIDKTGKFVIANKYTMAEDFKEGLAKVLKGNKFGYVDLQGKEVIPFIYDSALSFSEGLAAVGINGKYGFIDKTGKIVIPLEYDFTEPFANGEARVHKNRKMGTITKSGQLQISIQFDQINDRLQGYSIVEQGKKMGIIDEHNQFVIPAIYDSLRWPMHFSGMKTNQLLDTIIVSRNQKYGLLNLQGKEILAINYDEIGNFYNGLARVKQNNLYGMINQQGKLIIPIQYQEIGDFDNGTSGLAQIRQAGKYGYVNAQAKEVIPAIYDSVRFFNDGLIAAKRDGKWGVINHQGKIWADFQYEWQEDEQGLKVVTQGDFVKVTGFLNKKGEFFELFRNSLWYQPVIDQQGLNIKWLDYKYVKVFSEGLAIAVKGDKVGYIDKSGNTVIPFSYQSASNFSEGLALVRKGNQALGINQEGKILFSFTSPQYFNARPFKNGIAVINNYSERDGALFSIVNNAGKVLTPYCYEEIEDFTNGMGAAKRNGKMGFLNEQGQEAIAFVYDEVRPFSEGLAWVCQGEQWGCIDTAGKFVIPLAKEYRDVRAFKNGVAIVGNGQKYGCIDKQGKWAVPMEHPWISGVMEDLLIISNTTPQKFQFVTLGIVDKLKNEIVPINYYGLYFENPDLVWARVSDPHEGDVFALLSSLRTGYINKKGENIIPFVFDYIEEFRGTWAEVRGGFINQEGRVIVSNIFDDIIYYDEEIAVIRKDDRFGILKNPMLQ